MTTQTVRPEVLYPDSDGKPMADNTLQYEWIVTIKGGLDALFRNDPDVFVAGDLLWYPVRGDNRTRLAPDALVAFGRPKGYRGSYQQWLEDGIAPQVVFEVLSPGNSRGEMASKRRWYERYGVDEYYEYDPDHGRLAGWQRQGEALVPISEMQGWISPRLVVKFGLDGTDLVLTDSAGERFESFVQHVEKRKQERERAEREATRANHEAARAKQEAARARQAQGQAEQAELRAKHEAARAEHEAARAAQAQGQAEQAQGRAEYEAARAEHEAARAEQAESHAARLAARLRALGLSEE